MTKRIKITRIVSIAIFLIIACFFSFSTVGFAEDYEKEDIGIEKVEPLEKLPSRFIAEPKLDMEAVLNEHITEARVRERYNMSSFVMPKEFTYDKSVYLVEYYVSTDFWESVKTLDYKGLTEAIFTDYPTVYVPLFADVADADGKLCNRQVGFIRLRHDARDDNYMVSSSMFNTTKETFKQKKNDSFYEKIAFYLIENNIKAEQVFLLRYPTSFVPGQETVAVIKTESDAFILDISNSLHLETDTKSSDAIPKYSISEYKPLRLEVEKELYQTVEGWENVNFGGIVYVEQNNGWIDYLIYGVIITVVLGAIAGVTVWLVARKRRKLTSE